MDQVPDQPREEAPAKSRARRREELLAELAEARALRRRVMPRRTQLTRAREVLRRAAFRR